MAIRPPRVVRNLLGPAAAIVAATAALAFPDLGREPSRSGSFADDALGIAVPYRIYLPAGTPRGAKLPTVLYFINHGGARPGTEPDSAILTDFLADGYLLVVADYQNHPSAVSPALDHGVLALRNAIANNRLEARLPAEADPFLTYVVPQGFRLLRDVVYWEIDRHAAHGTLEHILREYQRHAVPNRNARPASSVGEMLRPDGSPFDYRLQLDIIYPASPTAPVPVMMIQSSTSPRNRWQARRPHYIGYMLRGFAFAHYDHNYNPIARDDHFRFYDRYSLDGWNGIASNSAAVRCVRAHATRLDLNPDRIGIMGHSKASYGAVLLADPNHHRRPEWSTFPDHPAGSPEPQPWPGFASQVTVGYQSMGDGTQRHRSFTTEDYAPTILACGELDYLVAAGYWAEHAHHFALSEIPHLALFMKGIGHTVPTGFDPELGLDRYTAVIDFIEQYLREGDGIPPLLLYGLPVDGATGVARDRTIGLRFAPGMDATSVTGPDGVRVIAEADGHPIPGAWSVRQRNTYFQWTPTRPLAPGSAYTVVVPPTVRDLHGTPLGTERRFHFVTGADVLPEPPPVDTHRRQHDLLYRIADAVRPPFDTWPEAGRNVDRLPAFSISPYSAHTYTAGYHIVDDDLSEPSGRHYLRWTRGRPAEIRIDLGQPHTISQIVLTSGAFDGSELVRSFRLRAGNSGPGSLETIAEVENNADRRLALSFAPVTARWFHLDQIGRPSAVRIHDLEMYESPRPLEPALTLFTSPPFSMPSAGEPLELVTLSVDDSVVDAGFIVNGSPLAATRDGNAYRASLNPLTPGPYRVEAWGRDAKGRTTLAPPISFHAVSPTVHLLRDGFTIDDSGGRHPALAGRSLRDWKVLSGQWDIRSAGRNRDVALHSPNRGVILAADPSWGDGVIEIDLTVEALQSNFSIIFRAADEANYDRFQFRDNRMELYLGQAGSAQRVRRNRSVRLVEGNTYAFRIELTGSTVTLFIDGEHAMTFESLTRPTGGIGFATQQAAIRVNAVRAALR